MPFDLEARTFLATPVAFVLALHAAWPLARLLGVPPMSVLAGPCPTCTRRPPGWLAEDPTTDPLQLACGRCEARFELWLAKTPLPRTSAGTPRFVLPSPKFLGRWRRVD